SIDRWKPTAQRERKNGLIALTLARTESATEARRHGAPRVRRAARSAGHTAERGRARVGPIITRLVHDACRPRAGPAAQAHASNPIGAYTARGFDCRFLAFFLCGAVPPWPNSSVFSASSVAALFPGGRSTPREARCLPDREATIDSSDDRD